MILCVGGTPAMQRTLRFEGLEPAGVNQAYEVRVTAAGKAVNVARVFTTLGGQAFLATLLGGDPGRFVARELDREGVPHEAIWTEGDGPTRVCTTLLPDGGPVTELVEEAPPVSEEHVASLEAVAIERLEEAQALCLIGSLPPGVPEGLYARLTRAAREANVPVLANAKGASLRGALEERPFLVKPNLKEAADMLELAPSGDEERDAKGAVGALIEAGARWALLSMGAAGSLLGDASGGLWRVEPPQVEARNPISSGDSLVAGLLLATTRGSSVPGAALYGTACATANALTLTPSEVRPAYISTLLPQVLLEELS